MTQIIQNRYYDCIEMIHASDEVFKCRALTQILGLDSRGADQGLF